MGNSQKFSILKEISNSKQFSGLIPPFVVFSGSQTLFEMNQGRDKTFILRSGLEEEGGEASLLSGKSLSIGGINSAQTLLDAWERIQAQAGLGEVILQEEFPFEDHLTIFGDPPFYYIEIKTGKAVSTLVISPDFISGSYRHLRHVEAFLQKWSGSYAGQKILLEVGVNASGLKIFQANRVNEKILGTLFNHDLIFKFTKAAARKEYSLGLLALLKKEFRAHQFRKKSAGQTDFSIYDAFNNWSYLLHYFFIYCRMKRKHGSDQDFVDFLNACKKEGAWLSKTAFFHLTLSSRIRQGENKGEEQELGAAFRLVSGQAYYLGQGIYKGKIEDIGHLCHELLPEDIYRLRPGTVILTTSRHLLSHGFLIALERGIAVIANIDQARFGAIKKQDYLTADFSKKSYVLE